MPIVCLKSLVVYGKVYTPALLPKVFDNYAVSVMIGSDPYTLELLDTAGASINCAFVYSI